MARRTAAAGMFAEGPARTRIVRALVAAHMAVGCCGGDVFVAEAVALVIAVEHVV